MTTLQSYPPRRASSNKVGNVRRVLNGRGQTVQETHYYPYGMPFGESNAEALAATNGYAAQPYKYGGKESISMCDLSFYDFAARPYDPALAIFHTPDPMQEKYMGTSSHLYCLANPINYTDPSGMTVVADMESQKNIANTLTAYEEQFLSFDSDGLLDSSRLLECENMSENMKSLAALAESEIQYNFISCTKDSEGVSFHEKSNYEYYRGVTEMPGAESNPSKDSNVNIRVYKNMSEEQRASTTAHEAYGHAYVYEVTRDYKTASHTYETVPSDVGVYDSETKTMEYELIRIPTNQHLENRIIRVSRNAQLHYLMKHSSF